MLFGIHSIHDSSPDSDSRKQWPMASSLRRSSSFLSSSLSPIPFTHTHCKNTVVFFAYHLFIFLFFFILLLHRINKTPHNPLNRTAQIPHSHGGLRAAIVEEGCASTCLCEWCPRRCATECTQRTHRCLRRMYEPVYSLTNHLKHEHLPRVFSGSQGLSLSPHSLCLVFVHEFDSVLFVDLFFSRLIHCLSPHNPTYSHHVNWQRYC
jgi:hypothetical protein